MQNVYGGSVGCKMYITEQDMKNKKCELRNYWVQNVYDQSVRCKMHITEQAGHEK